MDGEQSAAPRRTVDPMTMSDYWDRRAAAWSIRTDDSSDRPDPYGTVAIDALPLGDGDRVLDIGCGPAHTTVELAQRVAPEGHVHGVDVSPAMIAAARRRVEQAIADGDLNPDSIDVSVADVQHDDLGTRFDAAFSRFGVMFFDDPAAAFANIASALRLDGRLSFVAWGTVADNPWATVPTAAAAQSLGVALDPPDAGGPGPFSLGDVAALGRLLEESGFAEPIIVDISQGRRLAHDTAHREMGLWLAVGPVGDAYAAADDDARHAAIDAALASIDKYRDPKPHGDWVIPAHAHAVLTHRI
jgi:SAM-dependent methyltransferase